MTNYSSPDRPHRPQSMVPGRESARESVQPGLGSDEIESLLRMARENSRSSDHDHEDLGPGDVQYLRGDSEPELSSTLESELARKLFGERTPPDQVIDQVKQDLAALAEFSSPTPAFETQRCDRPALQQTTSPSDGLTIEDLGDVDLDISIELGRTEILIEEILKLREGSVVALDKLAGDPVDIVANGRLVARGELLVIDGKFGVRLSEVL